MNIQELTAPLAGISLTNWLLAAGAAIASYAVMHAAVALFRKRLCRISHQAPQADSHIAELLKATLARTSNIAVVVTALLIGLSLLDLPPPWGERVRHLWFIALGAQFALYLDRAVTVTAQRYFRHHATDPEAPATVAHTLMIWAIKTVLWVVFLLAVLSNLGIDVSTPVSYTHLTLPTKA